jgi:GNAT superfamily N-acetyltransferase
VQREAAIRLLRPSDLPQAMHLKECAGWNQSAADWKRLLELEPGGCFGLECAGRLAATATALIYGPHLAWIGMVLTLPEFRGHGFATRMMRHAIAYASESGVAKAGLDATGMGIGVYRRLEFEPEGSEGNIQRWARPASSITLPNCSVDVWQPHKELDLRAFGADRSDLLSNLAGVESASVQRHGYAMGRPGSQAAYFGPCVADSPGVAADLLRWYLASHPGAPVYWDILTANRTAEELAREHGFSPLRVLTRMFRTLQPGAEGPIADASLVYATAGFECG